MPNKHTGKLEFALTKFFKFQGERCNPV